MEEIIKNQIKILEKIQDSNKDEKDVLKIAVCIAITSQINELIKTYIKLKEKNISHDLEVLVGKFGKAAQKVVAKEKAKFIPEDRYGEDYNSAKIIKCPNEFK